MIHSTENGSQQKHYSWVGSDQMPNWKKTSQSRETLLPSRTNFTATLFETKQKGKLEEKQPP